ncbi:MAG: AMP-binding protein [Verrucomicrobiae bacterium]|nr:AMP-binding protein [Verrucomicrobiae bacterium]
MKEPLSIRRFFTGKKVLLTGATGFLAKAVMEKILHDLPEIGGIYLLIRSRRKPDGTLIPARERLHDEILRNSAFGRLREKLGEDFEAFCEARIRCVSGDLTLPRLGLSETEFQTLAREIDVIINSAATVVFDERLDLALSLNTLGPARLLELAQAGHALYVHISTAYVCGKRTGNVPEKLLDPLEAIDAQLPPGVERPRRFVVKEEIAALHQVADQVKARCAEEIRRRGWDPNSEDARNYLEKELVDAGMRRAQQLGWNDTYTFTKFLGEQLVREDRGRVPVVIVRPSIIESSLRDPEPGWLDGLRMADPIIIGFGKGRLNDFPANRNIVLDIIPADFVVNCVLAAAAHIAREPSGFDLFTVASSTKNPLWFESLYTHVRDYFLKHPFTDRSGRPIRVQEWKFRPIAEYRRLMVARYLRPAQLGLALVNGPIPIPGSRKWRPRLKNYVNKIEQLLYYVDIYGPYVNLDCRFETERSFALLESLEPEERKQFNFDPRVFHWRGYLQDVHIPGLKRNILRMDAVPRTGAGQGRLLDEEARAAKTAAAAPTIRGVPQTIVDIARRGHERFGSKTFLEIRRSRPENGPAHVRLTYTDFWEKSGHLARKLAARLNLHVGDRVALMGENCPEWALAYLAIVRAGATAVPLDRMLPAGETRRILEMVGARALVISPACLKTLRSNGNGHGGPRLPLCLNLLQEVEPFAGEAWPHPKASPESRPLRDPAPEALASLLFTSGTTVEPKGVMLTHANFVANAMAVSEVLEPLESDRFLSVLPLHHAFEFTAGFLIPMLGGASIYHLEQLKAQEVLDAMRLNEITVMLGVPRLFKLFRDGIQARIQAAGLAGQLMLEAGELACLAGEVFGANWRPRIFRKVHEAFGGHIRVFVSGGAALDPDIFHYFKRFGLTICEGYGLTETSPVLTVNPLSAPKAGSVGPVIPGMEINILPLEADDEIGEILVRGPSVMHGYWHNPQATAAVFTEGWFKTGDLGKFDEDGYLYITGRLKDIIVTSAGKNVYPDDVEHHLQGLPGLKEMCVIGLPGRDGQGEEVTLVVVPENPEARPAIEAAVAKICADLPSHQRVSRLEFQTEDLPKTTTLKIQRAKVRQRYLAGARPLKPTPAPAVAALAATPGESLADTSTVAVEVARAVARVAGNLTPAEIEPHHKLQMDLGIDSIGRVDLLQTLEVRFSLTLPPGTEDKVLTVQDVVTVVEQARQQQAAARPRRTRRLWERAQVPHDALQAGMRQTRGRLLLRGLFEAVTGFIMSTHLRVRGDGLEHLPAHGPYILAANHSSHLDLPAIRKVLGPAARNLHAMAAKDYFFNTPFKRWFFTTFLNALPLDREANAAESLAVCKTVLDSGRSILIFPEGTRSITGDLQPFKPGVGVLAVELDYPIIPVWIQGAYDALPKGRVIPRPGHIEVRIGPPVDFSVLRAQREQASISDLYRRAAHILREQVEALADLPPLKPEP